MNAVVVPAALDGERIDRVVAMVTGLSRAAAGATVDAGGVRVGGVAVTSRSRKVRAGEQIDVDLPEPPEAITGDAGVAVAVVHVDDAVIVVDKPAGLVVHPGAGNRTGTLVHGLLARYPDLMGWSWPDAERPGIVHRIDKGTSGLLMVARTPAALVVLQQQLRDRTVERRYLALVSGTVDGAAGVIDAPLGRSSSDPTRMAVRADGRRAVTRYEVVARYSAATLLSCSLETGRTHQIRVHLAAVGHPVVGDARYKGAAHRGVGRPFLHAAVLGFDHPESGERLRFESPLPADLAAVIDAL